MERRVFLGTAATISLAGCIDFVGDPSDVDGDIGMSSDSFDPEEYEIEVGDTVTWVNTSSKAHTVTAFENAIPAEADYFATGGFESEDAATDAWFDRLGGRLDVGQSYSHTFEVPGTYDYYCIPHIAANMVGQIIVTE